MNNNFRILRAEFDAEQHMTWQALHLPPCSWAIRNASAPAPSAKSVAAPAPAAQSVFAPAAVPVQGEAAAADAGQTPALPIAPFPSTPAYPGDDSQTPSLPIAPFPSTPAYPGNDSQAPAPGGPVDEGQIPSLPIAPFPSTPAYPGNDSRPNRPGQSAPVRTCWVRFLHAAFGYDPLRVLVGSNVFTPSLSYASMTEYRLVREGFRSVTITSASGGRPILLRRDLPFRAGEMVTVAIIDTDDGLELMQVPDSRCQNQLGGCGVMRMVNLALNSPPLDMRLYDGAVLFGDVHYREITPFKPVRCGDYMFYLIRTTPAIVTNPEELPYEPLVSFGVDVRLRTAYTCYVLGRVGVPGQILQLLVAEDD